MAWTFEATEAGYTKMWRSATMKGGPDAANADTFSDKIIAAEARYRAVQAATGVPWYFQGALHMRESGCNFAGVLHNGEKIIGTGRVTTLVPAGRGPFSTWEEAAIDALKLKDMHRVQSWSVARMLFQAEVFNGLGYVGKGINSPYVWAGTNNEQSGKYVADHVFDPNADDTQLGVAAVLIRLAQKRPDIHADLYPATPEKPPVDVQQPPPTGQTLPPETVTPYNAGLEDCIIELAKAQRPILERYLKAPSAMTPEETKRMVILALGGTPPPSSPVVLLPGTTAPAPAAGGTATPAAPASPTAINISAAIAGVLASLGLSATGVIGAPVGPDATTAGMLLPILAAGAGALGIPAPIVNIISTLFGKLTAPTPPKA